MASRKAPSVLPAWSPLEPRQRSYVLTYVRRRRWRRLSTLRSPAHDHEHWRGQRGGEATLSLQFALTSIRCEAGLHHIKANPPGETFPQFPKNRNRKSEKGVVRLRTIIAHWGSSFLEGADRHSNFPECNECKRLRAAYLDVMTTAGSSQTRSLQDAF